MLPLSAIPKFNGSFNGDGDMVVHFTGDGSLAVTLAVDYLFSQLLLVPLPLGVLQHLLY